VDEKLLIPKDSGLDAVHILAKGGLSTIPCVGGVAAELFSFLIQAPVEKRKEEWMSRVVEKLLELEANGFKLDELRNNEEFLSAVMHASQIASRSHQAVKLDALRNAVLNVARGQAPEAAFQSIFLNLVDNFTELHLRVLKVFQAPLQWPSVELGRLSCVLEHNIPELRGRKELYDQIWKDLYWRGLVNTDGLHAMMSDSMFGQKRTTGMGDAFLGFIDGST